MKLVFAYIVGFVAILFGLIPMALSLMNAASTFWFITGIAFLAICVFGLAFCGAGVYAKLSIINKGN
jgi:hypothetical protein